MGTWSQEFINVSLLASVTPDVAIRTLVAQDILLEEGERTPKVLYFPRRADGSVWWVTLENETLVLPEHITVMIAPGALISPLGARGRLVIRGELQAPLGAIFPSTASPPPGIAAARLGQVDLLGPRLEYVHPEWWGGGVGAGPGVDSHAIEESVRVATQRATLAGGPAVIELLGRYQIRRPLRLFQNSVVVQNIELRGRPGGGDDATILAGDGFVGEALFDLGSSGGRLVCRDVRFDARSRAGACVRVALGVDAPPEAPIELPHELSRCGFRGAIDAELVVFASGVPAATKVATGFVAPASRPAVDLNGCVFTVLRAWAVTQENRPSLLLRVGARLLGPEGASTRFFNCVFVGEADAMIFASAQEVVTTGCRFANESFPESLRRLSPDGPAWRTLHAARLEGGVDIVLEGMPVEDEQEVRVTGDGLAPLGWRGPGLRDVARAYVGPLASLTAQDCRSTSPQFLFARRAPTDRHVGRDSTVIGLHHAFDSAPIPDPLQLPPPILWLAREGVPSGPSLQLIGCRIDGDSRRRAPMVFAPDGGNDQPTVFDYGTSSDRAQLATPVGHGAERFPGAFAPTAVGHVPFRR